MRICDREEVVTEKPPGSAILYTDVKEQCFRARLGNLGVSLSHAHTLTHSLTYKVTIRPQT